MTINRQLNRKLGTIVTMTAATLFGTSAVRADHTHSRAYGLSRSIVSTARHLAEDVEIDIQNSPRIEHVLEDAQAVVDTAEHLYASMRRGASLDHLQVDLQEVSEAHEHLNRELAVAGSTSAVDRKVLKLHRLIALLQRELTVPVTPALVAPVIPSGPRFLRPGSVLYAPPSVDPRSSLSVRIGGLRFVFSE